MNIELLALLKWGWGAIIPWLLYNKQKQDRILESIIAKAAQSPTYEEMEKEIAKSVSVIKDDQKEMIIMTREMNLTLNQLVKDLAVLNAKWSMTNEKQ